MKEWFTRPELTKLSLPGLAHSPSGLKAQICRENWNQRANRAGTPLARKRSGRGGGYEYHYSALPVATIAALTKRGLIPAGKKQKKRVNAESEWMVYDGLSKEKKEIANFRLGILHAVLAVKKGPITKTAAIEIVRQDHQKLFQKSGDTRHQFTRATVYNWFSLVKGRRKDNWLPALAPKQAGRAPEQDIAPEIIDYMRGDYLRPEKPSFKSCYYRLEAVASERGWTIPHVRTLQRRFLKGVPQPVIVLKRDGYDALEAMFPPQTRDRSEFHAMEAINADGHIWDVFVTENGSDPFRPVMCAVQDIYSGKILSWRIGRTLGADIVRLSFGDCFRDYGIPDICWLDNGREFAAKLVTGGTPNRFRFKVKEEEPVGFLTALGVDVRWTRPYRGQSKPIERAFRDFCDHIAKHPKFAGAYTGNKVTNKPSNYGKSAVDMDTFKAVVSAGIEAHNARANRRTRVCQGKKSFDDVFEASYAQSSIRRATEAQLRMCMLAGEVKTTDKRSGVVTIMDNSYWSEELANLAGERVIARFDPDDLHNDIHIYRIDGSYAGPAQLWAARGFADAKAAREHSNAKRKMMKATKDFAKAEIALSANQIADMQPDYEPDVAHNARANPKIIEPVFAMKGNAARKVQPVDFEQFEANIDALEAKITDIEDYR